MVVELIGIIGVILMGDKITQAGLLTLGFLNYINTLQTGYYVVL